MTYRGGQVEPSEIPILSGMPRLRSRFLSMNPLPHHTQTIHPDNLQPGTYLIDRYQDKEKVLRRVEPHDSFVQLFFEDDAEPFACSTEEAAKAFRDCISPFSSGCKSGEVGC